MLAFDHLVVSAEDLAAGSAVERHLGASLASGGKHPDMATHNRLLGLGAEYLEVIAGDPDVPAPDHSRWFDLDRFSGPPRLTHWVCRTDHLAEVVRQLPGGTQIREFRRSAYRWRMAIAENGHHPMDGAFPGLIQWDAGHPSRDPPESGVRLEQLEIRHPRASDLAERLGPWLDDARIVFTSAERPSLVARMRTPLGVVLLT